MHDTEDSDSPFAEGAQLARGWAGSSLMATTGLGHRRILRDPDVVERVAAFIDAKAARPS